MKEFVLLDSQQLQKNSNCIGQVFE